MKCDDLAHKPSAATPPNRWDPPSCCVRCGHRVSYVAGHVPIATRKFPPWLWPFMILDRWHARLMRHVPREFWDGITPKEP
jgi:hypothetical protein